MLLLFHYLLVSYLFMKINLMENQAKEARFFAIGELFFVLLPIIVLLITFSVNHKIDEFFKLPEWSILTAVMFGQSIIKNIHIVGKSMKVGTLNYYQFGAIIAAILIIGLIPSLVILSLIFTLNTLPFWVYIAQLILFIIAIILFYFANGSSVFAEVFDKM
jgi:hypothetical protein